MTEPLGAARTTDSPAEDRLKLAWRLPAGSTGLGLPEAKTTRWLLAGMLVPAGKIHFRGVAGLSLRPWLSRAMATGFGLWISIQSGSPR